MTDAEFSKEISEAVRAHGAWKHRLLAAALKKEADIPVQDICRDDKCHFGKWLETIPSCERNRHHLDKVRNLHTEFHQNAGRIAQAIADGKTDEAMAALNSPGFDGKSRDLSAALMDWKMRG